MMYMLGSGVFSVKPSSRDTEPRDFYQTEVPPNSLFKNKNNFFIKSYIFEPQNGAIYPSNRGLLLLVLIVSLFFGDEN